jgi:hypothetical protein
MEGGGGWGGWGGGLFQLTEIRLRAQSQNTESDRRRSLLPPLAQVKQLAQRRDVSSRKRSAAGGTTRLSVFVMYASLPLHVCKCIVGKAIR